MASTSWAAPKMIAMPMTIEIAPCQAMRPVKNMKPRKQTAIIAKERDIALKYANEPLEDPFDGSSGLRIGEVRNERQAGCEKGKAYRRLERGT